MGNKAIIVSFSSRSGGNCEQISEYVHVLCGDSAKKYRFSDFSIHPCGDCQCECFANNQGCPYFDDMEYKLLDEICASDRTYFVLPNYCDYPCAHFFIFNERSQCFFQNHEERLDAYLRVPKRFIVVSNTGRDNFIEAMRQHTNGEPEILFLSAKYYGKSSIAGDILDSDAAKSDIRNFLNLEEVSAPAEETC